MITPPNEQVEAGRIAREAIQLGRDLCKSRIDGLKLNNEIEAFIMDSGGIPGLKGYRPSFSDKPYEHTICLSLNEEAVHGVPIKNVHPEDIITIDLVVQYQGWFADSARTFTYGDDPARRKLVDGAWAIFAGSQAAILPAQSIALYGASVGMSTEVMGHGIVQEYCGHGIGQSIHMKPQIVNYTNGDKEVFEVGRAYAVEPVLTQMPTYTLTHKSDGWTVVANCLTVHNEDTVFISDSGVINLTGTKA